MDNVGGHQYLGGTIQDYDEYLHQIPDILIISGSYGGHNTTD